MASTTLYETFHFQNLITAKFSQVRVIRFLGPPVVRRWRSLFGDFSLSRPTVQGRSAAVSDVVAQRPATFLPGSSCWNLIHHWNNIIRRGHRWRGTHKLHVGLAHAKQMLELAQMALKNNSPTHILIWLNTTVVNESHLLNNNVHNIRTTSGAGNDGRKGPLNYI